MQGTLHITLDVRVWPLYWYDPHSAHDSANTAHHPRDSLSALPMRSRRHSAAQFDDPRCHSRVHASVQTMLVSSQLIQNGSPRFGVEPLIATDHAAGVRRRIGRSLSDAEAADVGDGQSKTTPGATKAGRRHLFRIATIVGHRALSQKKQRARRLPP
jgi:hypothetical protein